MAIWAIIGIPGSGKSYEGVRYHICDAIKNSRKVVTNVPLNVDWFVKEYGEQARELIELKEMTFEQPKDKPRDFSRACDFKDENWKNDNGQGALFVVDEAHLVYPPSGRGKQQSNDLQDCLEYFSGHRHYGHDIILMTQSLRKINNHVRDMIETQYILKKHTALGSNKSYTQTTYDGATGRPSEINSCIRRYEKKYFEAYKSHTQSDCEVKEAQAADIKPIYKRFSLYWPFLVIIYVLYYSSTHFSEWLGAEPQGKTEQVETIKEAKSLSSPSLVKQRKTINKVEGVYISGSNHLNDLFMLDGITNIYISNVQTRIIDGISFKFAGFEVIAKGVAHYVDNTMLEINGCEVVIYDSPYNGSFSALIVDSDGSKYRVSEKPYALYNNKQIDKPKPKSLLG